MKKIIPLLIFICCARIVTGQSLISNWSFENNMQLTCQGWHDACGNELTISCDTLSYCGVRFRNVSPSVIPEEMWSIELVAGMLEGFTETYITGQSGTNIYQLQYMMKSPDWGGTVSIGTLSQNQYTPSKTLTDSSSIWKSFEFVDTLTTQITDTIVVRLSAGFGDFCICTSCFDLISVTIIDSITTIDEANRHQKSITIYPNPTSGSFELSGLSKTELRNMSIYNILGVNIDLPSTLNNQSDISHLPDGVYFLLIETDQGIVTKKVIKR